MSLFGRILSDAKRAKLIVTQFKEHYKQVYRGTMTRTSYLPIYTTCLHDGSILYATIARRDAVANVILMSAVGLDGA